MSVGPVRVLRDDDIINMLRIIDEELPESQTMYPSYMRASITSRLAMKLYHALGLYETVKASRQVAVSMLWLGMTAGLTVCSLKSECRAADKFCRLECAPYYMAGGALAALYLLGLDIVEITPAVVEYVSVEGREDLARVYRAFIEINEVIPVMDVAPHLVD